jgi:stage V sporulation protein S
MNRFFSKLDLRDIKIDPEGTRFPPDADESEEAEAARPEAPVEVQAQEAEAPAVDEGADSYTDSEELAPATWESATYSNGHSDHGVLADETAPIVEVEPVSQDTVITSNGHLEHSIDGVLLAADGEVLKVSARSRPSAVAGAIAGVVREAGRAEVQAIGAGATNQAVKAVAIAREYLRETGIDAVCVPAFIDVTIENEDRTAIRLVVEPR